MNKLILASILLISGCVMEQQYPNSQPKGPGQTVQQTSFHPTLYVSPGTVGGVSKSTYSVTEIKK